MMGVAVLSYIESRFLSTKLVMSGLRVVSIGLVVHCSQKPVISHRGDSQLKYIWVSYFLNIYFA